MPTGPDLPSAAMLMRIAADHGLDLTAADADSYRALTAGAIESYRRLEEFSEPEPPVKYPRDGGWRPRPEDNPCNGWYWRCNIAGAASGVHRQQIRLDGTPADVRAFPDWFAWSPMADAVRTALATPVAQGQVRPWETTAPQPAGERSQSRLRE
jgi:hypothetical protein